MAETLRERLARSYSLQIYLDGSRTFTGTNESYHLEVQTYAATHFTDAQLLNALTVGWITQAEYDETIALMPIVEPPTEPIV